MTTTYLMNNATIFGDIAEDILDRELTIAHGNKREDKQWVNRQYTGETFLTLLSRFGRGEKDGPCILQGSVVDPSGTSRGVQRQAKNVKLISILMLDHDTGETMDEIAEQIKNKNEFCVLWTTHSHMKPISMIAEAKVLQWMKDNKIPGSEATPEQVLDFLRYSQKIHDKFLTGAEVLGRDMVEGGRKYKVKHQPMPRLRSLFFLKDTFNFATRPGSQKQVIEEWKSLYAGACVARNLPFDPACVDPSRLMYLPRIAEDADITQHEIRIIGGGFLDLSQVAPVAKTRGMSGTAPTVTLTPEQANILKAVQNAGTTTTTTQSRRQHAEFKTPGLTTFLKREGRFFRAADFMQVKSPMDQRYDYNDGKIDFKCPNEDGHTNPNETDRAFFVTNFDSSSSDAEQGSWIMRCPHTTCLGASMEDRAWYLDLFCVNEEITDVADLYEFCDMDALEEYETRRKAEADAEKAKRDAADADARNDAAITARIDALESIAAGADPEPLIDQLKEVLARRWLLEPTDEDRITIWIGRIAAVTGRNKEPLLNAIKARKRTLADELRAAQDAFHAANNTIDPSQEPPFTDPSTKQTLWPGHNEEWSEEIVAKATLAQLERANHEVAIPRLFLREEGGVVRVTLHRSGKLLVEEMDAARWRNEIIRTVEYKKETLGGRKHIAAPQTSIDYVVGEADKDFNFLERVVKVPVFSTDGTLLTERGYIPEMRTYLHPNFEMLPVPQNPSIESVKASLALIRDALTDFPFSDAFDGNDKLPIKLAERDEGGHQLPNPDRGKSSYANMLALILQPFVQHMINGPSPAFHIDKAAPGTGAGYLVDVVFFIAEGKRATVRVMSDNNEEFKKAITATLRQGAPIIFIDNINRKVDSGALAAALTSGTWSDRVLGVSENVDIEVKSVWVMAGNNLTYSDELYRRNVPIRLDAKTPNPAQDRGQEFFKHFPLHDWLSDNRPRLVQACHIIIANWLAKGRPRGSVTMNSFDSWAATLGGILETAGVEGFLSNIPAYLIAQNQDRRSHVEFVQALWTRFKDAHGNVAFDPDGALSVATDAFGNIQFGLPIDTTRGGDKGKTALGVYIGRYIKGRTFLVGVEGDPYLITWVAELVKNKTKHHFERVSDSEEAAR